MSSSDLDAIAFLDLSVWQLSFTDALASQEMIDFYHFQDLKKYQYIYTNKGTVSVCVSVCVSGHHF